MGPFFSESNVIENLPIYAGTKTNNLPFPRIWNLSRLDGILKSYADSDGQPYNQAEYEAFKDWISRSEVNEEVDLFFSQFNLDFDDRNDKIKITNLINGRKIFPLTMGGGQAY